MRTFSFLMNIFSFIMNLIAGAAQFDTNPGIAIVHYIVALVSYSLAMAILLVGNGR